MAETSTPGPVDFVLIEFPDDARTDAAAAALESLVDSGTIRLFDIAAVAKSVDGSVHRVELDVGAGAISGFEKFVGARSGLFDSSDISEAGGALDPGTSGLVIAYENSWAGPFVAAAHEAGGQLVASDRIPAEVLLDALDAAEAVS